MERDKRSLTGAGLALLPKHRHEKKRCPVRMKHDKQHFFVIVIPLRLSIGVRILAADRGN